MGISHPSSLTQAPEWGFVYRTPTVVRTYRSQPVTCQWVGLFSGVKRGNLWPLEVTFTPPHGFNRQTGTGTVRRKRVRSVCCNTWKHEYLSQPGRIHLPFCWLLNLVSHMEKKPEVKSRLLHKQIFQETPPHTHTQLQYIHVPTHQSNNVCDKDHHVRPTFACLRCHKQLIDWAAAAAETKTYTCKTKVWRSKSQWKAARVVS